jgi:hypothetical protein
MAYVADNLAMVFAPVGGGIIPRAFVYQTAADADATIVGAGYFLGWRDQGHARRRSRFRRRHDRPEVQALPGRIGLRCGCDRRGPDRDHLIRSTAASAAALPPLSGRGARQIVRAPNRSPNP